MTAIPHKELQRAIVRWSHDHSDILATVVIGSYARVSPPPFEYSDLDLILFSLDPSLYATNPAWLQELGDLWIAKLNYIGPGDPEWLALFDGGIKADFVFVSARRDKSPAEMLAALPYQDVLARGVRVIYSRHFEHQQSSLSFARVERTRLPSEQMFEATVNSALFAVERFVKFIHRGDVWRGQTAANVDLRRHLLTLIEWHAQSLSASELDTWYEGRYMDRWADGRVLDAISSLELEPDLEYRSGAVANTLALVEWLATETATQLGYAFPTDGQAKALAWLNQISRGGPE